MKCWSVVFRWESILCGLAPRPPRTETQAPQAQKLVPRWIPVATRNYSSPRVIPLSMIADIPRFVEWAILLVRRCSCH